jgi:hypothetical protein
MPSSGLFNNSKTPYLQGPENVGGSHIIPNLCLIYITLVRCDPLQIRGAFLFVAEQKNTGRLTV